MVHLLIADDEMLERAVLYKTLHKNLGERCVIFQAENGREALEIYEEHDIQVAILDIEMPGVNGIEAAERIRKKDKDCCIIFLTAFDEFAYARKAITVRALDYLLKPYEERELMIVVEEAIRLAEEVQKQNIEKYREEREAAGENSAIWPSEGKRIEENPEEISHLLMEETEELENSRLSGVREKGEEYIHWAREQGKKILVVAGRPYHMDPEINHD